MRSYLVTLLLVIIPACGAEPDTADDDDDGGGEADAGAAGPDGLDADADSSSPDAMAGGLPLNAECDVFADGECAAGLTCRLADSQGNGLCRTVGELAAGSACSVPTAFYADQPCGQAMICNGAQPNGVCQVLCDLDAPTLRCSPGDSCSPVVDGVGVCH